MPYIMNSLETPVSTQAHGKWFAWTPLQIKTIHSVQLAQFLEQYRKEEGLVQIPDEVMEMDKNSQEFKDRIEEYRRHGVQTRIQKLDWIIHNLEVSLRRDLDRGGIKQDPLTEATKGELAAYKERAKLVEFERRALENTADAIRKIKEEMEGKRNGGSSNSESGTNNSGRSGSSESTKS